MEMLFFPLIIILKNALWEVLGLQPFVLLIRERVDKDGYGALL
jgi:hypothetical protein